MQIRATAREASPPSGVASWSHRVIGPADVAALAVHVMANTALTGAT
jgi:hypothetical protein